jgi:hypothetical protein
MQLVEVEDNAADAPPTLQGHAPDRLRAVRRREMLAEVQQLADGQRLCEESSRLIEKARRRIERTRRWLATTQQAHPTGSEGEAVT